MNPDSSLHFNLNLNLNPDSRLRLNLGLNLYANLYSNHQFPAEDPRQRFVKPSVPSDQCLQTSELVMYQLYQYINSA